LLFQILPPLPFTITPGKLRTATAASPSAASERVKLNLFVAKAEIWLAGRDSEVNDQGGGAVEVDNIESEMGALGHPAGPYPAHKAVEALEKIVGRVWRKANFCESVGNAKKLASVR
jgi:hypothetical protein